MDRGSRTGRCTRRTRSRGMRLPVMAARAVLLLVLAIDGVTLSAQSATSRGDLATRAPDELLKLVDETLFPDSFVATFRMTTE
ncbi:MAG TPA: hypothetical protein VJ932_04825, partial [Alkalispirochaeta sp.]|nr:hypothetical protein [Alkalispirochaeta sp.]